MAHSQNGWTVCTPAMLAWFRIPGTNVSLRLRKNYAGPLLAEFARAFHVKVEAIHDPGCWSFANRPIRGSATTSNHASGSAIDLNAPRHPLGKRGTFSAAQVAAIHSLLTVAGGTIRWGGSYTGRVDEMHFEVNTKDVAAVLRATEALRRVM
jgi:hypothetical protein